MSRDQILKKSRDIIKTTQSLRYYDNNNLNISEWNDIDIAILFRIDELRLVLHIVDHNLVFNDFINNKPINSINFFNI